MKKHIPNLFTLGNMLCGMLAILSFVEGAYLLGIILVGLAAFLDFFDGFVARLLGVSGDLGKQLDSLADVVSFGVAPAIALMLTIQLNPFECGSKSASEPLWCYSGPAIWTYIPLLIGLFSAYRLAKFNVDTRQSDRFIGLPTPANSILILSVVYTLEEGLLDFGFNTIFIGVCVLTVISCFLLVSEIPLLALKFKNFKWKGNQARYLLILGSIIIFALSGIPGLAIVVLLYLLISIIDNRIHRHEVSR
ncbi:CDP-alcohol phosphatidyltransferase family protein [Phaeocystidibacter luteus]|nr:CDP-alcohol phosphatidyltransferase family protein [Phaeocystidibacter luteus]